jgi:hypothetical protein
MRRSWERDPVTGLPLSLFYRLDVCFVRPDGTFRTETLSDCNIYHQNSAAFVACGWINPARIRDEMVRDPTYPWRPIYDVAGRVLGRATHANTVVAWWATRQEQLVARVAADPRLQNLRPFRISGVTPAVTPAACAETLADCQDIDEAW